MTDKRQTARQKLQKAKDILATSPDANGLTVALLAIHGALDDWFGIGSQRPRSRSRRYDILNYREMPEYKAKKEQGSGLRLEDKLDQLRRDGIITRDEYEYILDMRKKRNAGAHGGEPDVAYVDVELYCDLVGKIMGERARRENMAKKGPPLKSKKSAPQAYQSARHKRASSPPTNREQVAPPPVSQPDPVEPPQSVPLQPQQAHDNYDLLSELLQMELGGNEPAHSQRELDNNELLRQLLA